MSRCANYINLKKMNIPLNSMMILLLDDVASRQQCLCGLRDTKYGDREWKKRPSMALHGIDQMRNTAQRIVHRRRSPHVCDSHPSIVNRQKHTHTLTQCDLTPVYCVRKTWKKKTFDERWIDMQYILQADIIMLGCDDARKETRKKKIMSDDVRFFCSL